jgi:hypothetical protein
MRVSPLMRELLAADDELPHLPILEALLQFGLNDAVQQRMMDVEVLLVKIFFIIDASLRIRLPPQHY